MTTNSNDKRRSFSTYFLGFVVFLTLVILVLTLLIGEKSSNVPVVIAMGCFVTSIIFSVLMIITLNPHLKDATFSHTGLFRSKTDISFTNCEGTMVTSVPEEHQPKEMSVEEKAISFELKQILRTGFIPENCDRCLSFLEKHEDIVQKSWTHTLNKSRFLRGLGKEKESEEIAQYVLEAYSTSRKAIGTYYEVYSWFAELEYNQSGKVEQHLLDKRAVFIKKGIQYYPESYQLWLNSFEVACLQKDAKNALVSLNKVIKIDKGLVQKYFLALEENVLTEMMQVSNNLHKKIQRLVDGGNKMKKLELANVQNLILTIVFTLSLFSLAFIGISHENTPYSNDSLRCDGTSVGRTKANFKAEGTSVGKLKASFKAKGTSVG